MTIDLKGNYLISVASSNCVVHAYLCAAAAFASAGSWVLPTESKQTRGMFNWYTNPYTYVIVGGMMGALVGLGVWCIVASYTYKA